MCGSQHVYPIRQYFEISKLPIDEMIFFVQSFWCCAALAHMLLHQIKNETLWPKHQRCGKLGFFLFVCKAPNRPWSDESWLRKSRICGVILRSKKRTELDRSTIPLNGGCRLVFLFLLGSWIWMVSNLCGYWTSGGLASGFNEHWVFEANVTFKVWKGVWGAGIFLLTYHTNIGFTRWGHADLFKL